MLIGILESDSHDHALDLLAGGATAMFERWTPVEQIIAIVELAAAGWALVPARVLTVLLGSELDHDVRVEDWRIMAALASGVTVAAIAASLHISEREAYRRLQTMYRRHGVASRAEAIALHARSSRS